MDAAEADRPYTIPTLVTEGDKLELLYPIRIEIGTQRVPVLTCWKWLRHLKQDSFLYAILSGRAGWEDKKQFLDSITEASPVPTLVMLGSRDSADVECVHLIMLFKLLHARALDEDPVVTPVEMRVQPDYRSRVTELTTSGMTVLQLVRVMALADQYGV